MKKRLCGIGIAVLAASLIVSVVSYRMSPSSEESIFALGVLDFGKRLHLADTEHPIHYESGEQPFYEKAQSVPYSWTHTLYQRGLAVSALIGTFAALILFYYASTDDLAV
jgi:hypothetical protein